MAPHLIRAGSAYKDTGINSFHHTHTHTRARARTRMHAHTYIKQMVFKHIKVNDINKP